MRRGIHKLATWLVLVVYLLSGIAPAQSFVVCLEPDGTISLEAAVDADRCSPCGDSSKDASAVERETAECCLCIDIQLPTRADVAQARPKVTRDSAPAALDVAPVIIARIPDVVPAPRGLSEPGPPRKAPGLDLVRTVVLRV